VLDSGNSVELNAAGYSMFPTLRPGDRVVVKPVAKGEVPVRGSVVVFVDNGAMAEGTGHRAQGTEPRARSAGLRAQGLEQNSILVMHRLVEIKRDDSDDLLFITRGDSGVECDKPWPIEQLVGEAVSFKRAKREIRIKIFVPRKWRYRYNQRLLWMFNKIMRILR
jgi:signal peptidase I